MPLKAKPRHVAQLRLNRAVGGQSVAKPRELFSRLEGRASFSAVGEGFHSSEKSLVWDHHAVPMSPMKMAKPEPNAPLLKRIIRYPMQMEPLAPVRIQVFDTTRPEPVQTKREGIEMVFKLPREARDARSPMATIDHALEWRPHPFGRRRRATEEER